MRERFHSMSITDLSSTNINFSALAPFLYSKSPKLPVPALFLHSQPLKLSTMETFIDSKSKYFST